MKVLKTSRRDSNSREETYADSRRMSHLELRWGVMSDDFTPLWLKESLPTKWGVMPYSLTL